MYAISLSGSYYMSCNMPTIDYIGKSSADLIREMEYVAPCIFEWDDKYQNSGRFYSDGDVIAVLYEIDPTIVGEL